MDLAPILLFTYNRPSHTRQTIEALLDNRLSDRSEAYIFSDGNKDDSDKKEVLEVRELIHSIKGFKKIHIIENTDNRGLAKNIIHGVTRIVNEYGKVIVVEDDLVTSPFFLTFMNKALDMFKNEDRIGHIHGYCYPLPKLPETFLIQWTGSWGWATWKRSWQHFNPDGKALLSEIEGRNLSREFDFNGNYPYTRMLRRQIKGENDSWAIRWNASLFLQGILSLNAGKSLVQNIGFDGSGTHSGKNIAYTTRLYGDEPKIEVREIEENKTARKIIGKYYRRKNSIWAKLIGRITGFIENR